MFDWLLTDPDVVAALGALKAAIILLTVGVLGLLTRILWGLGPLLQAAIREWLTTRAFARWNSVAKGMAAELEDPGTVAISLKAKAEELVQHLPDAARTLGADAEAAERTLSRARAELRVAPIPEPIANSSNSLGLKP